MPWEDQTGAEPPDRTEDESGEIHIERGVELCYSY